MSIVVNKGNKSRIEASRGAGYKRTAVNATICFKYPLEEMKSILI